MITLEKILDRFNKSKLFVVDLVNDVSQVQAIWKPAVEKWSILEVICHLVDEEKKDFRTRLDYTLNRPGETWPSIDPPAWVTKYKYNKRDLNQSIEAFLSERQQSIQWLSSLQSPDFTKSYNHAVFGIIQVGDLLISWVAHDLLHIRQIALLKALFLEKEFKPFEISYALP
jgi:hypothetical protein